MRHYVHVYTVVRIKVAVEAETHAEAMEKADGFLAGNHYMSGFTREFIAPECAPLVEAPFVMSIDDAEECTGYLVDEGGDEEYARSSSYGPDRKLEVT